MTGKGTKLVFYVLMSAVFIVYLFYFFSDKSIAIYFVSFAVSSAFFLCAMFLLRKVEFTKKELYAIVLISVLIKLLFIGIEPKGSDDYYRYLWDGKILLNGVNPFQYNPDADELKRFSSDLLPAKVTYPEIKTIYFPLAQLIFAAAVFIGGETAAGLKTLYLIFDLYITFFIFLLLKKNGLKLKYVLIYSLTPLVVFQTFVDAHVDIAGAMFFLSALYFFDKKLFAALLLGASLSVKPAALLAIPIFVLAEKSGKDKIIWLTVPILFLLVSFIPFALSANPFEALINFSKKWTFNGLVYNIVDIFSDDNYLIRIVCLILFVSVYSFILFTKLKMKEKLYYSFLALFLFSPIVHPWYLVWLTIPLVYYPRFSGIAFISTASLAFYTVVVYQTVGAWNENVFFLIAEYLPVVALLIYEIYSFRRERAIKQA